MTPYSQNNQQNTPYKWQSGDTSTFAQQAQNLSGLGNQGLNTGLVDVQQQTAQAQQKAGQSAENAAQGASQVATGAQVDPTVAQAAKPGDPTVQPYKVTQQAPAAPDTSIMDNTDFMPDQNFNDPTQQYLNSIFNGDVPKDIQDAINASTQGTAPQQQEVNPQWQTFHDSQQKGDNPFQQYITTGGPTQTTGLSDAYQNYINQIQQQEQGLANNPQDLQSYKNAIGNQLQQQLQALEQKYQTGQGDITQQNNAKQKAISDYINNLQKGLATYQTNTQDLGNVGGLSEAEQASAAMNGVLAGPNVSGTAALSALSNNAGNTRLNALSQQAQNAAIQQAEGQAGAAQAAAQSGAAMQAQGAKDLNKSYTDAGNTITKNQTDSLNKLQDSQNNAQQALSDAYNNTKSNLSNQEQDYVNKAQDTLKNSNVPQASVVDATSAFANMVQNQLKNGNLSQQDKDNLKTQLESIWRIAVGSNNSDIHFSDQIAGILSPIAQSIGETLDKPS